MTTRKEMNLQVTTLLVCVGMMFTGTIGLGVIEIGEQKEEIHDLTIDLQKAEDAKEDQQLHIVGLQDQTAGLTSALEKQTAKLAETEKKLNTANDQVKKERKVAESYRTQLKAQKKKKKPKEAIPVSASSSKKMTGFQLTWYNDPGTTASGVHTQDGITAAVDPSKIPYGSKLKITLPSGKVLYRTAQDTGGAVKHKNGGKVVDIYANTSTSELFKRGRTHNVTVEIVGK